MPTVNKEENLHIRASTQEKAALAEAARLRDQKLSQFVLTAALTAARKVLAEENVLRLSPEEYDAFVKRLDEPPRDLPGLREQLAKMIPFHE